MTNLLPRDTLYTPTKNNGVQMKIGDLVKKVNPWTGHNPWMIFPEDDLVVGLVVELTIKGNAMVLWAGESNTAFCRSETLGVIK